MEYAYIQSLIQVDLDEVNELIRTRLHSSIPLVNELTNHIIASGGKRLRPMLALLSARACGYQGPAATEVAATIEFIHTATLMHDDVIDNSSMRRGQPTANSVWGNKASVLVGDFLYSRAFQMMVHLQSLQVMEALAKATNIISEGEVLQLMQEHKPETTESTYLQIIYAKTAALFEVATELGAIVAKRPAAEIKAMADYGRHLGLAFQLVDDVLDYRSDLETLGKNPGDDLADGKATLPFIYALEHTDAAGRELLETSLRQGLRENFAAVTNLIESTGAIEYTYSVARKQAELAQAALETLSPSAFRQALSELVTFALERTH